MALGARKFFTVAIMVRGAHSAADGGARLFALVVHVRDVGVAPTSCGYEPHGLLSASPRESGWRPLLGSHQKVPYRGYDPQREDSTGREVMHRVGVDSEGRWYTEK